MLLGGQTPPPKDRKVVNGLSLAPPPPGSKGPMTLTLTVSTNDHKAVHAAFYAAFFSINKVHYLSTCYKTSNARRTHLTRESGHAARGSTTLGTTTLLTETRGRASRSVSLLLVAARRMSQSDPQLRATPHTPCHAVKRPLIVAIFRFRGRRPAPRGVRVR